MLVNWQYPSGTMTSVLLCSCPNAGAPQTQRTADHQGARALWEELNTIIRECGGWTVSQPNVSPIRFECQIGSGLPDLLRQAGHRVIEYGTHERLMPVKEVVKEHGGNTKVIREQVAPGTVGVWQFDLPSVDTKPLP